MNLFRFLSTKLAVLSIVIFFAACSNSNVVINKTASVPLVTLTGKAVDVESNEPIAEADILIGGTTKYTTTDDMGAFSIQLPAGYYEVYVDHPDFKESEKKVNLIRSKGVRQSVTINAEKIPSFLRDREVDDANTKRKAKNVAHPQQEALNTFVNYYITDDDLKCGLENPEDVRFADNEEEGVTWVNEPTELVVMNYELGYRIHVFLEEYVAKEYSQIIGQNVDASYFFEELEPINKQQEEEWEQRRKDFFEGSFRHFLIAMASEKSPLYFGYRIFSGQAVTNTTAMAYSSSSVSDIEKEKSEIVMPSFENENYLLRSDEEIRIEYIEQGVDDPDRIMGLQNYRYQTSWISLNGWSAEFTRNGLLKDKNSIELKGYWRYVPVCKMLPEDYLPKINKDNS